MLGIARNFRVAFVHNVYHQLSDAARGYGRHSAPESGRFFHVDLEVTR
jgi:hypothetical protein